MMRVIKSSTHNKNLMILMTKLRCQNQSLYFSLHKLKDREAFLLFPEELCRKNLNKIKNKNKKKKIRKMENKLRRKKTLQSLQKKKKMMVQLRRLLPLLHRLKQLRRLKLQPQKQLNNRRKKRHKLQLPLLLLHNKKLRRKQLKRLPNLRKSRQKSHLLSL